MPKTIHDITDRNLEKNNESVMLESGWPVSGKIIQELFKDL